MDRLGRFIPIFLCVLVAMLQLRLAVHCKEFSRSRPTGSSQKFLFDVGAFIFLTGIQALLLRSFLGLRSGDTWIAVVLMSGIAIVIAAISLNLGSLLRRK